MTAIRALEGQALLIYLVEKMQEAGSWAGETHIQKSVYFLQELLGVPTAFDYILYKHGPYSFELHDELADMKANSILCLERRYPYGPSFGPGELAQATKQYVQKTLNRFHNEVDFVARTLSNKNVGNLERLATALYVLKNFHDASRIDQANLITEYKPHISYDVALQSLSDVEDIMESAKVEGLRVWHNTP